ncbi:MAG TPA: hypothetical protein VGY58_17860, partial [Gemmataceae bacterium]|nr:hypothetical protein [Gemmataceae bacterium]
MNFWTRLYQRWSRPYRGQVSQRKRLWAWRPVLELLEHRWLPTTFTVTNTNDSGVGTLRQAILDSNANPTGPNSIIFNIGSGLQTITPTSALPAIQTNAVMIDGTTQPGFAGSPLIELNGVTALSGDPLARGLMVRVNNSLIRGLIINRFEVGIDAAFSHSTTVVGNYVGTDSTGLLARGNTFAGVYLQDSNGSTIGGTTSADRNIISGNAAPGVEFNGLDSPGTVIEGNYIGLGSDGTTSVANTNGVFIGFANSVTIGGLSAGAGNVISGNSFLGVDIGGSPGGVGLADNNVVEGNLIGTDFTGTLAAPNSAGGVFIGYGASNNTVGGPTGTARNIISGNGGFGVEIYQDPPQTPAPPTTHNNTVQGNYIGTNQAGTGLLANGFQAAVFIDNASANTIDNNVIAGTGSEDAGVLIEHATGNNNLVTGNIIGADNSGNTAIGNLTNGIDIQSNGNTIGGTTAATRNVIVNSANVGIAFQTSNSHNNLVEGNYVGIGADGHTKLGNAQGGVDIFSDGGSNTIGRAAGGAGNVISGNGVYGVRVQTAFNVVAGNLIGIDTLGSAAGNSGDGVVVKAGATNNTIGGPNSASRNIISGNKHDGVGIRDSGTTANKVQNNYIGLTVTGDAAIANSNQGVDIYAGASGNVIGGDTSTRNVISGNTFQGVVLSDSGTNNNMVAGNYIGTDASGGVAVGNLTNGVLIINGAQSNVIGTNGNGVNDANEGNVISGNGFSGGSFSGIGIAGSGTDSNVVAGNFIGTNAAGLAKIPNSGNGVSIETGPKFTRIGTNGDGISDDLERNVVSGNNDSGVSIAEANQNIVAGNYLGTDKTGNTPLPNAGFGFKIIALSLTSVATGNQIGTTGSGVNDAARRNVISGNA